MVEKKFEEQTQTGGYLGRFNSVFYEPMSEFKLVILNIMELS